MPGIDHIERDSPPTFVGGDTVRREFVPIQRISFDVQRHRAVLVARKCAGEIVQINCAIYLQFFDLNTEDTPTSSAPRDLARPEVMKASSPTMRMPAEPFSEAGKLLRWRSKLTDLMDEPAGAGRMVVGPFVEIE